MPKQYTSAQPLGIDKVRAATGDFEAFLLETLQHPQKAQAYLEVALEEYEADQDAEAFLLALRTLAKAQGGVAVLAEKAKLSRQNLYRALSGKGNPRLDTLTAILHGLGFRLCVKAI